MGVIRGGPIYNLEAALFEFLQEWAVIQAEYSPQYVSAGVAVHENVIDIWPRFRRGNLDRRLLDLFRVTGEISLLYEQVVEGRNGHSGQYGGPQRHQAGGEPRGG